MQSLNLPSYDFRITNVENIEYIFDIIRNKPIVLTPEEWVRQHMVHFLLNDSNYPKGLIKVESGLVYNDRVKRSDIIIYDNQAKPYLLVECKAPAIPINQSTLEQVAMYNRTLNAPIIVLTNGLTHYTFRIGEKGELINLEEIPKFRRN